MPCAVALPAQKHVPTIPLARWSASTPGCSARSPLADALGLQSGISFPVAFELPIQIELDGLDTTRKRSSKGFSDQYSATRDYQWILVDRPHPKVAGPRIHGLLNPIIRPSNSESRAHTRELSASGLFDIENPAARIRTIHLQFDAARDLAQRTRNLGAWCSERFDRHDDSRKRSDLQSGGDF